MSMMDLLPKQMREVETVQGHEGFNTTISIVCACGHGFTFKLHDQYKDHRHSQRAMNARILSALEC